MSVYKCICTASNQSQQSGNVYSITLKVVASFAMTSVQATAATGSLAFVKKALDHHLLGVRTSSAWKLLSLPCFALQSAFSMTSHRCLHTSRSIARQLVWRFQSTDNHCGGQSPEWCIA